MNKTINSLLIMLVSLLIAGCFDSDDNSGTDNNDTTGFEFCGEEYQKDYVYSTMEDWYYWYDLMPDIDPQDYSSPEAVLDAVRYTTLDSTFSYIISQEAEAAFFNNAAYVGFGFSTVIVNGDELFLREVFAGGPADQSGLLRGDRIVEIDGVAVSDLIAAGTLNSAYGPNEVGVTRSLLIEDPDTLDREEIPVTKDEVEIPVVSAVEILKDGSGNDVGYLFFRSFNNAAYDALDDAFAQFADAGVTRVILDLRYNGGGLLAVAEHLAGLLGGDIAPDSVLTTLTFNDKRQSNNVTLRIEDVENAIGVTDLVVITTEASASASEMIIKGLEPYITVRTVGSATFGKPVGQSGFEYCDDVLRPVTFETLNANGEGGYYEGIAAYCDADDDLFRQLGDAREDSIAEALTLIETGNSCSYSAGKAAAHIAEQKALAPNRMQVRDGWDVVTGGAR